MDSVWLTGDRAALRALAGSLRGLRLGFDDWSLHATGSDDAYRWAVAGASDGLTGKEQIVSVGP